MAGRQKKDQTNHLKAELGKSLLKRVSKKTRRGLIIYQGYQFQASISDFYGFGISWIQVPIGALSYPDKGTLTDILRP
jgi:hypothetical protein